MLNDVGESCDEGFAGKVHLNTLRVESFATNEVDGVLRRAHIAEVDQTLRRWTRSVRSMVDVDRFNSLGQAAGQACEKRAEIAFGDRRGQFIEPEDRRDLALAEAELKKRVRVSVQLNKHVRMRFSFNVDFLSD